MISIREGADVEPHVEVTSELIQRYLGLTQAARDKATPLFPSESDEGKRLATMMQMADSYASDARWFVEQGDLNYEHSVQSITLTPGSTVLLKSVLWTAMVMMRCSLYPEICNLCRASLRAVLPRSPMGPIGKSRSAEELREMLREAEERKVLWEKHYHSAKMDQKRMLRPFRTLPHFEGHQDAPLGLNMTDQNGIPISHPLD